MARANGYILTPKQLQKQSIQNFNFEPCMDISPDNATLVFGYGPIIKFVSINSSQTFWFKDKKTLGKLSVFDRDLSQKVMIKASDRLVRDLRWNFSDIGKNLIGVAMGECVFAYDVEDQSKTPQGYTKLFSSQDVMRQGDYPSRFVWYPNSKDIFLCTSSKSDEIVGKDLRGGEIRFGIGQFGSEQKVEDLKFKPGDGYLFATILKNSTIQIFDYRKPGRSIIRQESLIQNYKTNLLDWQWKGNQLVSAFGGLVKIWSFNGQKLQQKQSFQHKNAISDFKWLRKHPQYLLFSEMQQNIIYGYNINKGKHDLQILVDPRHSGLKKFITDRNEQLILGLTNFQDSKKHQSQMIAVFIDYESSKMIWSETKFTKPNHFGLDNQLLYSATRYGKDGKVDKTYSFIYKQVQSFAKKIDVKMNPRLAQQWVQEQEDQDQKIKRKEIKLLHRKLREQRKKLKKQVKQIQYLERSHVRISQIQSQRSEQKSSQKRESKLKKSVSIDQKKHKKSFSKHPKSLQKSVVSQKKSNGSFSQSSDQSHQFQIQKSQWILSYSQEIQYLDKYYLLQPVDQLPSHSFQSICKHNSKVARSIGKHRCAEFWQYLYPIAFPEPQLRYTLPHLYEDKTGIEILFKQTKVLALCQQKSQMQKKTQSYSLTSLLQSLIDQNELQTAIMAIILLRNHTPSSIPLSFLQPLLICYKQLLKAMDLTFISTNISFLAKLNQAIQSSVYRFQIPIGCGQCYKKFSKCTCLQVCVLCGDSLVGRLVIGCKICGHMAHARELQGRVEGGDGGCWFGGCRHQCFKNL